MSHDDAPRDPITGRVPPHPLDASDPTTQPMWSVGFLGQGCRPEDDDKTGITEVERRLLAQLEKEYEQMRHYERGSARWGEALCATQGAYRALRSLYDHPWKGEQGWENEGTSKQGYSLILTWATRIY